MQLAAQPDCWVQVAAPAPANTTSTPGVDVVFGVTLPQASENSLLVLQSNSSQVRAQFAGLFVYAMSTASESPACQIMC